MERRLAAIMAVDVVGYSRLMGEDEDGTLAALRRLREEVLRPEVAACHGRVVKLLGDGILAEFPSAHDAVESGLAVQRRLAEQPGGLQVRIGINVGDVIPEGEDIYGDGVNVASRLQALAEPGGVCVSGNVAEYLRGQEGLAFDYVGERRMKNISRPIAVYHVHQAGRRRRIRWRLPGVAGSVPRTAAVAALAAVLTVVGIALVMHFGPWGRPEPPMSAEPGQPWWPERRPMMGMPQAEPSADPAAGRE